MVFTRYKQHIYLNLVTLVSAKGLVHVCKVKFWTGSFAPKMGYYQILNPEDSKYNKVSIIKKFYLNMLQELNFIPLVRIKNNFEPDTCCMVQWKKLILSLKIPRIITRIHSVTLVKFVAMVQHQIMLLWQVSSQFEDSFIKIQICVII